MRVALAAVLFSAPDLLLLDEPTNYLDLEGAMWLVDYLVTYPATVLVISHDRDLLDDVVNHILHLDKGKLTLWSGGYSSFERQRAEMIALQGKTAKKQEERRKHLQSFVDRFRASATKASQAQSRLKMLAKMAPVAVVVDDSALPFSWPPVARKLASPLVALEGASVGYDGKAVLTRLSLSLQADDRIGLIGANGNGKSTFAKLMGGRMELLSGKMVRAAQAGGRLLRPASGRRSRPRRQRLHAMSRPGCAASRKRKSAPAWRASAFRPGAPIRRSSSFPAARRRGC